MRATLFLFVVLVAGCRAQNLPAHVDPQVHQYRQDAEQCARNPETVFCHEAPK